MKRFAAACVLLLMLAGCSSTAAQTRPTGAALDAIFLKVVREDAPPSISDAGLIRAAHEICDEYVAHPNTGMWVAQVKVLVDSGFTGRAAGTMVGASTATYCPENSKYAPKI